MLKPEEAAPARDATGAAGRGVKITTVSLAELLWRWPCRAISEEVPKLALDPRVIPLGRSAATTTSRRRARPHGGREGVARRRAPPVGHEDAVADELLEILPRGAPAYSGGALVGARRVNSRRPSIRSAASARSWLAVSCSSPSPAPDTSAPRSASVSATRSYSSARPRRKYSSHLTLPG